MCKFRKKRTTKELMLIELSVKLLIAVKQEDDSLIKAICEKISSYQFDEGVKELKNDEQKIVFWVNIYNAFFQIIANNDTDKFTNRRSNFFKDKSLSIFQLKLSFDDIEHQILRRSMLKFSLGYFSNPFVKKWERKLRVRKQDFRIHFLLNCGAVSCPMIRPLTLKNQKTELDFAMQDYFDLEVEVNREKKQIELNQLFLFYLGDFGGKKGLKKIFLRHDILRKDELKFKFKFTPFDKTLKLNNYLSE